jgi:EPS-associated MarR family transcriptional regulator
VPALDNQMTTDETTYKLFKALEDRPSVSQRELAAELDVSLGKVNYCLKALLNKGLVKADNFINSKNKPGYLYKLTPAGMAEKAALTMRFLKHEITEHNRLKHEIATLQAEIGDSTHHTTALQLSHPTDKSGAR